MTNTETEFRKVANMWATGLGGLAVGAGAGYAMASGKEDGETDEEYRNRRIRSAALTAIPAGAIGAGIPYLEGVYNKLTTGRVNRDQGFGGKDSPAEPEGLFGALWRGARQSYWDPIADAVVGSEDPTVPHDLKQRLKDLGKGALAIGVPTMATPFILGGAGAKNVSRIAEDVKMLHKNTDGNISPSAGTAVKGLAGDAATYRGMDMWTKIKAFKNMFRGEDAIRKSIAAAIKSGKPADIAFAQKATLDLERSLAARSMVKGGARSLRGLGLTVALAGAYPTYNALNGDPSQGADSWAKVKEVSEAAKRKAKEIAAAASKGNK